jgi:hypothetical protein
LKNLTEAVERKVIMWVYDGEEWTEEGGSSSRERKPEPALPLFGEMMPELQVIEIEHVPTTPRKNYIPVPLP